MRTELRRALLEAIKRRDTVAVSALRSALAAVDNADAVDPAQVSAAGTGGPHVAGSVAGLRAAEVERRNLTEVEVHAVVRVEIEERRASAADYERHRRPDRAQRLRAEADVLAGFVCT